MKLYGVYNLADKFYVLAKKKSKYSAGLLFYCPDDGTILLVKRSEMMRNPNLWDIPGGQSNKKDQDILYTAKREATEELDSLPDSPELLTKYIITKGKNSPKYHVFIYAISQETKKKWTYNIKLDKENSKFQWFKINALPDNLRYDLSWVPEVISEKGRIKIASDISKLEYTLPRFEYKFIIPETIVPEIKEFLEPYVLPDEHGKTYMIKNLYFDTHDLTFFRNHLESPDRFKLRVRTYNDDKNGFLEIKRKRDGQIIKSRVPFNEEEYPLIFNGNSKFIDLLNQYNARPKLVINYVREAYFLKEDPTTRITFDRRIKYKPTNSIELNQKADESILPNSTVVMEVKFYNKMPEKIENLIKKFNLKREPMSKYVSSISNILLSGENQLNINQELFDNFFGLIRKDKDRKI